MNKAIIIVYLAGFVCGAIGGFYGGHHYFSTSQIEKTLISPTEIGKVVVIDDNEYCDYFTVETQTGVISAIGAVNLEPLICLDDSVEVTKSKATYVITKIFTKGGDD